MTSIHLTITIILTPPHFNFGTLVHLIFSRALAAYTDALYNWGLLEQRASVRKHGQSLREEASRAAVSLFFEKFNFLWFFFLKFLG